MVQVCQRIVPDASDRQSIDRVWFSIMRSSFLARVSRGPPFTNTKSREGRSKSTRPFLSQCPGATFPGIRWAARSLPVPQRQSIHSGKWAGKMLEKGLMPVGEFATSRPKCCRRHLGTVFGISAAVHFRLDNVLQSASSVCYAAGEGVSSERKAGSIPLAHFQGRRELRRQSCC